MSKLEEEKPLEAADSVEMTEEVVEHVIPVTLDNGKTNRSKYAGWKLVDAYDEKKLVKKAWQEANVERLRQYRRTYYLKNREKILARKRAAFSKTPVKQPTCKKLKIAPANFWSSEEDNEVVKPEEKKEEKTVVNV
jgi:hypothetical protein